jgi:hypothetical protein
MYEYFVYVPTSRKIKKIFLHCSASNRPEHDDVDVIRKWHKARGWNDVGYHYFITSEGEIQTGRSIDATPAAQSGHNLGSIAICLHGLKKEDFNDKQFDALVFLSEEILAHQKPQSTTGYTKITFHGHCEVSSKTCPVFDYRSVLNLNDNGEYDYGPLVRECRYTTSRQDYFDIFSHGDAVGELQLLLTNWISKNPDLGLKSLDVDGVFGQMTSEAVRKFQDVHNLIIDGIAGPATIKAIFFSGKYDDTNYNMAFSRLHPFGF